MSHFAEFLIFATLALRAGNCRRIFRVQKQLHGRHPDSCQHVMQAIELEIEGKVEMCSLCAIEAEHTTQQLRSTALVTYSRIHSFLFSTSGRLLYANHNAALSLRESGASGVCISGPGLLAFWFPMNTEAR